MFSSNPNGHSHNCPDVRNTLDAQEGRGVERACVRGPRGGGGVSSPLWHMIRSSFPLSRPSNPLLPLLPPTLKPPVRRRTGPSHGCQSPEGRGGQRAGGHVYAADLLAANERGGENTGFHFSAESRSSTGDVERGARLAFLISFLPPALIPRFLPTLAPLAPSARCAIYRCANGPLNQACG
ncbi:hypothetical protein SKAU_G00128010 [Synaphobranchus kaupii]|uniref:Uncharacterized protein n=1 Tax=Synaphobranchus kaupii TaxID=118154 RepID=A0A9Q1FPU4_SYNKA|nr:hypothetical protein SKAU_G00128010 [Synaphobranchus kaupii]